MNTTLTTPAQTATSIPTGTYTIDPTHTTIGFTARHAMVTKVHGTFTDYTADIHYDENTPTNSRLSLVIKTHSIDTRNPDRDTHLKSNDFFDMANYPTITFTATDITKVSDEDLLVTGDLTIKGTTRNIAIPFTRTGTAVDPYGNTRVGFEGFTSINRKDWNVNWNAPLEAGGILVSDKVTLNFDISTIYTSGATA
jgi:polyisoprenoid-binding protein YceI